MRSYKVRGFGRRKTQNVVSRNRVSVSLQLCEARLGVQVFLVELGDSDSLAGAVDELLVVFVGLLALAGCS